MKHRKIILLTSLLLFLQCSLAVIPQQQPLIIERAIGYNWNYWAFEFGLGASYLHVDFPGNIAMADLNEGLPMKIEPYKLPLPDFRFGVEKCWQIGRRWTVAFDFACLTPALAFGYLVSDRTRFSFGFHYPVVLNRFKSLSVKSAQYSNGNTVANTQIIHGVEARNQFLYLSPRISLDHFTSPTTMIRLAISYDWHKFYDYRTSAVLGTLNWPQVTIGIKRMF